MINDNNDNDEDNGNDNNSISTTIAITLKIATKKERKKENDGTQGNFPKYHRSGNTKYLAICNSCNTYNMRV